MSWFRTVADGREIALARDNQTPTLYLSPGAWLDDRLRARLISVDSYPADRTRTGSIRDGARSLGRGNPVVKVIVPTRAVLIALCDAYAGDGKNNGMKTSSETMRSPEFDSLQPLNQILFGPPGTGKTYATVHAALAVLDPLFAAKHAADRKALKARFDALAKEQRVRFVTFHQSFSYEDFVEGLRAHSDNDCLQYRVESGVFQQICDDAKKIPEIATLDDTFDELLEELAVKAATATTPKGQSFQVSYRPGNDTVSCLPARSETGAPLPANIEHIRSVLHQRPVARMYCESYVRGVAEMVRTRHKTAPGGSESVSKKELPHVLIIDEINRGNVSRIFGELITLIEPSKRAGAEEALEVVLPYSKKPFSVPKNVYLIGTMNTADRSLASLDVALRRRFVFKAMPPQPELLDSTVVEGIVVGQLLRTMNQRIEALLDRDHCLGHAYFMPLRDDPSLARLGSIFRNQVLPLLQEYFFDDWQRIQWVLNDHRKPREMQFVQSTGVNVAELFGAEVNVARSPQIWAVNEGAFVQVGSYLGIVDHTKATGVQ